MVLGFPHNPTATTGEQAWLDAAVARAIDHDIVLAHDNPYVDLALDGEAPALLRHPEWRRCGIEFFSFSKGWCLGGYRIAFAIGAEWLITALRQLKGIVDFNQSLALQAGAIAALEQAPQWPEQLRGVYRDRRDRMAAALRSEGWVVPHASMALYHWLPVPPWPGRGGWIRSASAPPCWRPPACVSPPATASDPAARAGSGWPWCTPVRSWRPVRPGWAPGCGSSEAAPMVGRILAAHRTLARARGGLPRPWQLRALPVCASTERELDQWLRLTPPQTFRAAQDIWGVLAMDAASSAGESAWEPTGDQRLESPRAVLAGHQRFGHGQQGRVWQSPRGGCG